MIDADPKFAHKMVVDCARKEHRIGKNKGLSGNILRKRKPRS